MARIRTIKPDFWTDEKIVQLPFEARLLFIGMWNFADDDGFLADEPDKLRLQILPNDRIDVGLLVDLLITVGLIHRIDFSLNSTALFIPHFKTHQKISHSTPTKFPATSGKKRSIPAEARRQLALKYGCKPGEVGEADCYFCGAKGSIHWFRKQSGQPSFWVCFGGLEIDHFIPEKNGGNQSDTNFILSCRPCNRGRGAGDAIEYISGSFRKTPEKSGVLHPEGNGIEGRE